MRTFVLGLLVGVALSTAVGVAIWPEPASEAPVIAPDARPIAHEPVREPGRETGRRRVSERSDVAAVGDAEVGRAPPVPASTPADPRDAALERLAASVAVGDWNHCHATVAAIRRAHPGLMIPRELVEQMARTPTDASLVNLARGAAQNAVHSWPDPALREVLEELLSAEPGSHPLDSITADVAASLAERPHELNDLATRLSASKAESLRFAGLHLAATSLRADVELLARAARGDSVPNVRAAGISHLVARSLGHGDARAQAAVGPIAVSIFENRSSRGERESAIGGLAYGGERGLDIAQDLLREGGLDGWDLKTLTNGLIRGGRLPQVVESVADDHALLADVAEAVFSAENPKLTDVLAIWPYVPRVLDTPDSDLGTTVPETLAELERFDLIEELIENPRLSVVNRVSALETLIDDDAAPVRALELADAILTDTASKSALRQGVLYAVQWIGEQGHMRNTAASLAILERTVRDDPNQWVRDAADDAAGFVRKARTRWEKLER